jgi:hypothetical protein
VHQILKSKYFTDTSIWRAKPNVPKSAYRSSVIKILHLLQENSFYQICQGNISVWSTPWCSSWETIHDDLIIQQPHYNYPATVKDLWIPQIKQWNTRLIDSLFELPTANAIKAVTVIPFDEPDILCWKPTPNGKCNSKSAYKNCPQALFGAGSPMPTLSLLNKNWKYKNLLPRIKTFPWRIIRRAIPTGQRASRYSRHISNICCRCGLQERDTHLFFTCTFTRAAWFHSPWYRRMDLIT